MTLKVVRKRLDPFFSVKNFNPVQDGLFQGCSRMRVCMCVRMCVCMWGGRGGVGVSMFSLSGPTEFL